MSSTIEIFCCYAREDQPFLLEIKKHLMPLQRQRLITIWSDTDINAGMKWEEEIKKHLNAAQIILLLISADFMHSDYCYSIEMKRAMERHEQGDAQVIPIIVRPVIWESTPFSTLQALPTNANPIVKWDHPDDAYVDVAKEIRNIVEKLMRQLHSRKLALFGYETQGGSASTLWNKPCTFSLNETTYLKWLVTKRDLTEEEIVNHTWVKVGDHGNYFFIRFVEGGTLFESSFSNPDKERQGSWMLVDGMLRINTAQKYELDIIAYRNGSMYSGVECKNGMKDPHAYFVLFLSRKPNTKSEGQKTDQDTKPYEDALNGYNKIIDINPLCGPAYRAKGDILRDLKRYEEALAAYQQSIEVRPSTWRWYSKGDMLYRLGRYEDALAAFEQAIKLDGSNAKPWHGKGQILHELQRHKEALTAFDRAIALDPNYAATYYGQGAALYCLERNEESVSACQHSIKLDSRDARAYAILGLGLYRLGQYKEALSTCEQALSIDDAAPYAYLGKGRALSGLRRYEDALVLFEQTIHYAPRYAGAYRSKGDALLALEHYEEALDAYEQTLQYAPDSALTYDNKGTALYHLRRYEDALAAYEKASDFGYKPSQPYYDIVKRLKAIGVIATSPSEYGRTQDGKGEYWNYPKISVYWHPDMGIHTIEYGPIRDKWASLGWESGILGYPDTDDWSLPDHTGRHCHFRSNPQQKEQDGCIYWHPDTGAYEVHGPIRSAWSLLKWEQGSLGYPITDELSSSDGKGKYNHFQHGSIYYHGDADGSAHEVHGLIREKWSSLGWEQSFLGYPITNEIAAPDGIGRISYFQSGAIYLSNVAETVVLKGPGKSLQECFTSPKEFTSALEQAKKPEPTTLAAVIYHIDHGREKNCGYYRIGKNLDANGIAAGGWSKPIQQALTMKEHHGAAIALVDLDGSASSDMIIFRIDHYSEKNRGFYRVGKNLQVDGTVNGDWCKAIQVPSSFGKQNLGAGIASIDLNKSGYPDLLIFYVDCSENENRGFYRIGRDFDSKKLEPTSWSEPHQIPVRFGTEQYCTGIALTDLDGNSRPDLIVFYVEHQEGENRGYYHIGKHLDCDGIVTGGWSEPLQMPGSLGKQNHGASITIADLNRNGRPDLIVFYIEHPEDGGENRGYYRIGKNLDADGYARGGWSEPVRVPGEFGTQNQGAGIAILPF